MKFLSITSALAAAVAIPGTSLRAQSTLVQLTDTGQLKAWSVTAQTSQVAGLDCDTGDIDGDGDQDFVVAGSACLIYANAHAAGGSTFDANEAYGAFRMESALRIPAGNYPWTVPADAVHLADLDGDTDLDLIVGYNSVTPQKAYLNNGAGVFTSVQNLASINEKITSIDSADIDGDGDLDLIFGAQPMVVGNQWVGGQSQLYRNDGIVMGQLTFTNVTAASLPSVSLFTEDVVFGDLDNDGDRDLVLGNRSFSLNGFVRPGQNLVYMNNGAGVFTNDATRIYQIGMANEYTFGVDLQDLEGDGDLDLVVANAPGSGVVLNTLAAAGPAWALAPIAGPANNSPYNHGVAVGDIDLDGDPDLVFANNRLGGGQPAQDNEAVYVNNGAVPPVFTRTFLANGSDSRITGTMRETNSVALADLDRDGDLDLLSADWFPNQPGIYVNLHRQVDTARTVLINTTLAIDHYSQPQYGTGIEFYATILGAPLIPRAPFLAMGDLGIDLNISFVYPLGFAIRGTTAAKSTVSQAVPNDVNLQGLPLWYQTAFWGTTPNLTAQSKLSNVTRTLIQ